MPKEQTYPFELKGPYRGRILYVHTHIGSGLNRVLNGQQIAIVNGRLVKNMNTAGRLNKNDLLPDGGNNGIDYSVEEISPESLGTLGHYLSTYIKTGLKQSQRLRKKS
jgi:hypothetical protein